jgi:hypothetical protein
MPFAITVNGYSHSGAWQPLNLADCVADLLYMPKALHWIGVAVVVLAGPGPWSLDAIIATRLAH